MLKYNCALLLLMLAGLSACNKKLSNGSSDFTVTAQRTSLNAGDTARFSFAGGTRISSLSIQGNREKDLNTANRVQAEGLPILNFSTVRANGTQQNTLQLMISTDFKGVVRGDTSSTKANITAATWQDISSRASFAVSGSTAVPSGDVTCLTLQRQVSPCT